MLTHIHIETDTSINDTKIKCLVKSLWQLKCNHSQHDQNGENSLTLKLRTQTY